MNVREFLVAIYTTFVTKMARQSLYLEPGKIRELVKQISRSCLHVYDCYRVTYTCTCSPVLIL